MHAAAKPNLEFAPLDARFAPKDAGFRGLLPVHAVLLETVGDGQRCGKADPARTTSPAVHTRRYTKPMYEKLLLPAGRCGTCKKLQRAIFTKH